jgi:hypothetical protein
MLRCTSDSLRDVGFKVFLGSAYAFSLQSGANQSMERSLYARSSHRPFFSHGVVNHLVLSDEMVARSTVEQVYFARE